MAAPKIEKLLTPYNFTNKDSVGRIKYIVIHYVGALGGAKANCQYYASKYIGASAHYFVGFDGEIWQSVPDEDIAWHCGASSYKHAECRNANSIGIELCVRNKGSQADTSKDWYFEDATVKAAIELTKYLMQKYGVPASHVIRHYDVTGKICPNPYVYNTTKHTWDAFKKAIAESGTEDKDSMTKITGKAEATAKQMAAYIKAKNGSVAQSVLDMIPLYLSEGEAENMSFLSVLYKKYLYYFDYLKLDGMWELDGSHVLDAERNPYTTRIGYRYESGYELHEAGLLAVAYCYACRVVEEAVLKAAYSFRAQYFEYLKTDGTWQTDGSHVLDAEVSPREMKWGTIFRHQHEEELLLKQAYQLPPCEEEHSIRIALEQYRMVIDYFSYLKLNGLWMLNGSRLMDAQRTEYTTKQGYRLGVEHTREYRVIWHEQHNLIFLDGTWSLDGSKIIDAWQKTEVL